MKDEDQKPVIMPYDKHDAQLVAQAFQNFEHEWPQAAVVSVNMMFELREENETVK